LIKGLVQGVGFRPFIYRLAIRHGLSGEVENRTDGVSVIVQGNIKTIEQFRHDILIEAPPASKIKSIEINKTKVNGYAGFTIRESEAVDNQITEISPDIAVCPECIDDMTNDPERIDYPFVNCTNCGPRFTIIEGVPYDRPVTTMKDFRMCSNCYSEYMDIQDRRFHAQPIACNSCGPVYRYTDQVKSLNSIKQILGEVSRQIESGKTVAVKGTGGYFLMCDALNEDAVKELREKKQRDSKPFAIMFPDIVTAGKYCYINGTEETELLSWRRPILILKQKRVLSLAVSNGLNTTGAMLPYMPLHYLLFKYLKTPAVVLTSGNLSEEPIISEDLTAEAKLITVADSLVSYNRQIHNRTDDSVLRVIDNNVSLIRRSRGYVPRPVDLACDADGILAVGAEQKNCFCIGKHSQALMSQYIGNMTNPETFDFFKETIDRFSRLFRFKPQLVVCDLHPDYLSTGYARLLEKELHIPLVGVQHHHAHIASCMAEHGLDEYVIGISLDGTGFGTDRRIWGGEFLIAGLTDFRRFTHFDYVPMPGGDKVIREPWRMAFSYLYKYFRDNIDYNSLKLFNSIDNKKLSILRNMIDNDMNSPMSSGAGRLFDTVSALLGLCTVATFESEAPMRLESIIKCETDEFYPFEFNDTIIFAGTLKSILEELPGQNLSMISAKFHNTIARVILEGSKRIRRETELNKVILSGGVFQNKYLTEKTLKLLRMNRFDVFTNLQVPSNDGGISLGQLIIASKTRNLCV
jgi:hydrogenase maturation protein HypF